MQPSTDVSTGETRPERPPNYLVRTIILILLLTPLCLLLGLSSLSTMWTILTGPPVRSEVPAWMRALMEFLRVVAAATGLFTPVVALIQSLKVNSSFDAGDYIGAANASKSAQSYSRQSFIILIVIIVIMVADMLRYYASISR
jgi:Interferon-induced transmembrane protein